MKSPFPILEELAYARYESLMNDPRTHKHFMQFIFATVKDEVTDIVDFSQDECPLTREEAFRYFLFDELRYENKSLRDFFCQRYDNRFYPAYREPIIYNYDPNYDYINDAPYC